MKILFCTLSAKPYTCLVCLPGEELQRECSQLLLLAHDHFLAETKLRDSEIRPKIVLSTRTEIQQKTYESIRGGAEVVARAKTGRV